MTSVKKELIDLFNRWKEKQINEPNKTATCPKDMAKDFKFIQSFIADGCVDYDAYEKSSSKVLFILKEPASLRKKETYLGIDPIEDQMDSHWYKNSVIEPAGSSNKKYYKKFKTICDELNVDPLTTAMMNINKRGGYSSGTDNSILAEYTKYYKDEILEQIRILNPDIIVCCVLKSGIPEILFDDNNGTIDWKQYPYMRGRNIWLFKKSCRMNNKSVKIYGMPHPAIRMSALKYRELFNNLT